VCSGEKPYCQTCKKSGRQCEGYDQRFKFKDPLPVWRRSASMSSNTISTAPSSLNDNYKNPSEIPQDARSEKGTVGQDALRQLPRNTHPGAGEICLSEVSTSDGVERNSSFEFDEESNPISSKEHPFRVDSPHAEDLDVDDDDIGGSMDERSDYAKDGSSTQDSWAQMGKEPAELTARLPGRKVSNRSKHRPGQGDAVLVSFMDGGKHTNIARPAGDEPLASDNEENEDSPKGPAIEVKPAKDKPEETTIETQGNTLAAPGGDALRLHLREEQSQGSCQKTRGNNRGTEEDKIELDEDKDRAESDAEMQSAHINLNEKLRAAVAKGEAGNAATVMDEECEQWLKDAVEAGGLESLSSYLSRNANISGMRPATNSAAMHPRLLNATRLGQWQQIPDLLHNIVGQNSLTRNYDNSIPATKLREGTEWFWTCCGCGDGGMSTYIESCPEFNCQHTRCTNCMCEPRKTRASEEPVGIASSSTSSKRLKPEYRCRYCGSEPMHKHPSDLERHETACKDNPINKDSKKAVKEYKCYCGKAHSRSYALFTHQIFKGHNMKSSMIEEQKENSKVLPVSFESDYSSNDMINKSGDAVQSVLRDPDSPILHKDFPSLPLNGKDHVFASGDSFDDDKETSVSQIYKRDVWSQSEDAKLRELVDAPGAINWVRIAEDLGHRSPKQCKERYRGFLEPRLNHDPITPEEGAEIEQLVSTIGKSWAAIARKLPGRSDNAVKNWWNTTMKERQTSKGQIYHNSRQDDSSGKPAEVPFIEQTPCANPQYPSQAHPTQRTPAQQTPETTRPFSKAQVQLKRNSHQQGSGDRLIVATDEMSPGIIQEDWKDIASDQGTDRDVVKEQDAITLQSAQKALEPEEPPRPLSPESFQRALLQKAIEQEGAMTSSTGKATDSRTSSSVEGKDHLPDSKRSLPPFSDVVVKWRSTISSKNTMDSDSPYDDNHLPADKRTSTFDNAYYSLSKEARAAMNSSEDHWMVKRLVKSGKATYNFETVAPKVMEVIAANTPYKNTELPVESSVTASDGGETVYGNDTRAEVKQGPEFQLVVGEVMTKIHHAVKSASSQAYIGQAEAQPSQSRLASEDSASFHSVSGRRSPSQKQSQDIDPPEPVELGHYETLILNSIGTPHIFGQEPHSLKIEESVQLQDDLDRQARNARLIEQHEELAKRNAKLEDLRPVQGILQDDIDIRSDISGNSNTLSVVTIADSIFSSSVLSGSSMSSLHHSEDAANRLIELLLEDKIIHALCCMALSSIDRDRF
jgi:hypothetical protein